MNTRHEMHEAARDLHEKGEIKWENVSKNFKPNEYDRRVAVKLIELEGTPDAIRYFSDVCDGLSDYGYWFFLSTCWVKYSGWSDLELWIKLFNSERGSKNSSIMKPDELIHFKKMPFKFIVYRAHREGETNWIAYTVSQEKAKSFAKTRGVNEIKSYFVKRHDVLAYFTRRGEAEIIVLDKSKVKHFKTIKMGDEK